ncbi:MAG: phospholipase D-like domain-containing protein, partial [Candidatus Woesearchaeota archaeon]
KNIYSFILCLVEDKILKEIKSNYIPEKKLYKIINFDNLDEEISTSKKLISYMNKIQSGYQSKNYSLMGNIPNEFKQNNNIRNTEIYPILSGFKKMISETENELIILNPFFDSVAVSELKNKLVAAVNKGVIIKIITRYLSGKNNTNLQVLKPIITDVLECNKKSNLNLYQYQSENKNNEDLIDFHAKMIICDIDKKAYIGSANLTGYGLTKRLELGVNITGKDVKILYDLIIYLIKKKYIKQIQY